MHRTWIAFWIAFSFCLLGQVSISQLVINEILINATTANNDGQNAPNTGEWTELLNNGPNALDISCYVMTDGDWSVTFPPGTLLPPFGIITIGSIFSQIPSLDINLASCNCTSGPSGDIGVFTNGNEQLVLADNSGQIIDGIYWGSGQFGQTFTTDNLFGCPSVSITLLQSNPIIQQVSGSYDETETIYLPCNGSGTFLGGNTNPTPDAPNTGPIQTINPNANIVDENCGTLGSITLNPIGGVGPYEYLWSGALGNTNAVSSLQDGNYTVDITDLGQCGTIQNFSFVVSQNNSINLNITANNNTICSGESVTLTASGGSNYTWSSDPTLNNTSGSVVTATPNITTTYTVEDNSSGCINTASITIDVNNYPASTLSYNAPVCEGQNITLSSSTTTGNFLWSGPNGFSSSLSSPILNNVTQTQAGTYTLQLTQNNCTAAFTLPVSIDTPTPVNINSTGPFCANDGPVDLVSISEPGTWSGTGITDASAGIFDPSVANIGDNIVVFQSNNYCTAPANLNVTIQPIGDASITPLGNICEDSSPLQLQTITPGGQWTGNGVTTGGIVQPALLGPGSYQAIYTLSGNCGTSETLNFVINSNPSPSISVSSNQVCIPSEVQLNASNSSSTWQCEWWVDGTLVGSDCNNQDFLVDLVNCVNVQLLVTDVAGCSSSNIEPNLICGSMPPNSSFTSNPEQPFATDNSIEFIDLSGNATQLIWEIQGENFTTPTVEYPITGTEESIQLCLTAINAIGCEDKTCKTINIMDDYGVYVPTAFTPNEDGYNDGFGPVLYNLQFDELNYEFAIYSRDGEQVFLSKNPKQKWHGNKDGGDVYVLQDSYVWILQLNLPGADERKIYRGDVKILR
jgi:hypothetical protein